MTGADAAYWALTADLEQARDLIAADPDNLFAATAYHAARDRLSDHVAAGFAASKAAAVAQRRAEIEAALERRLLSARATQAQSREAVGERAAG